MQTLWWLPNKILRLIHKKKISAFWAFPAHLQSKCTKSANKSKKNFLVKNSIWVTKNAEFHADFESVEKGLKKFTQKKLLAKTWRKYALFSLLLMFVKLVLLVTFLVHFFTTFSTDYKSAWNSAFLISFFIFFTKNIYWVILALFANFEAKCAKNGSKKIKKHTL
jgi:hypothetical protein